MTTNSRTVECKTCDKPFLAKQDHGKWPKYCCRKCFLAPCVKPAEKECAACGALFFATRSTTVTGPDADGLRKYCSRSCAIDGQRRAELVPCLNCGADFYVKTAARLDSGNCCSTKCANEFYVGARAKSFAGGKTVHTQSGENYLLLKRPGYVGNYVAEHRIVVSKAIGRLVARGEVVIRLNRKPGDNRPENLFLCESISEFSRRRCGSLPWPTVSNLDSFKSN